jgi:dihydrodipicolinate synthase/N-acetylneuraminate lyase
MKIKSILGLIAGLCSAELYDREWRESRKIHGHMPAAFTPVDNDGYLDFTNLPKMQRRMQEWGISHVMLGGTTGESVSFSMEERDTVMKQWIKDRDSHGIKVY